MSLRSGGTVTSELSRKALRQLLFQRERNKKHVAVETVTILLRRGAQSLFCGNRGFVVFSCRFDVSVSVIFLQFAFLLCPQQASQSFAVAIASLSFASDSGEKPSL